MGDGDQNEVFSTIQSTYIEKHTRRELCSLQEHIQNHHKMIAWRRKLGVRINGKERKGSRKEEREKNALCRLKTRKWKIGNTTLNSIRVAGFLAACFKRLVGGRSDPIQHMPHPVSALEGDTRGPSLGKPAPAEPPHKGCTLQAYPVPWGTCWLLAQADRPSAVSWPTLSPSPCWV